MNDGYLLNCYAPSTGGYFSSEQVDLLRIVRCETEMDIVDFVIKCEQINHRITTDRLREILSLGVDSAKRVIFEEYQNSLVKHDSDRVDSIMNSLINSGVTLEDANYIVNNLFGKDNYIEKIKEFIEDRYGDKAIDIFEKNHRFVSLERDQIKDKSIYDDMVLINDNLDKLDTMLIGSGKIYDVLNLFADGKMVSDFDFYHAYRDLDFAYENGKQVRFHSLLVKGCEKIFDGKSRVEIKDILTRYVEATINFINIYNETHYYMVNGQKVPVINAVDLFNEIVSFDKDENGEYYNIWKKKFGITMDDIQDIFKYALDQKDPRVSYLYNEPMLEIEQRRNKVFETLDEIDDRLPGLIDTLGTQMHLSFRTTDDSIRDCYKAFKELQDTKGKKVQITEFDMSLDKEDIKKVFNKDNNISIDDIYNYKRKRVESVSGIINLSGVRLSGITYWSLTDGIDHNIERIRSESREYDLPTACGGLFPTYLIKHNKDNSLDDSGMNF